jgi:hypothetical protein
MYKGLQAKFATYPALRSLLISTDNSILVNASQGDLFWGTSRNGVGFNQLGRMLMDLREDFLGGEPGSTYANGHAYRSGYVDPSIALWGNGNSYGGSLFLKAKWTSPKETIQFLRICRWWQMRTQDHKPFVVLDSFRKWRGRLDGRFIFFRKAIIFWRGQWVSSWQMQAYEGNSQGVDTVPWPFELPYCGRVESFSVTF